MVLILRQFTDNIGKERGGFGIFGGVTWISFLVILGGFYG
jgi:hypothetical protein